MTSTFLRGIVAALGVLALLVAPVGQHAAAQSSDDNPANADRLLTVVGTVDSAVALSDWATARQGWVDFDELWDTVEDGFRTASRDNYREIESHQGTIRRLLQEESPDATRIGSEIGQIRDLITGFIN